MTNALKHITFSLVGTLVGAALIASAAEAWVNSKISEASRIADYKIAEASRMVDQKIADVANAPARAANNAWEAMKQATADLW